jgi:hypothetical protein
MFANVASGTGALGLQETFATCPGIVSLDDRYSWASPPASEAGSNGSSCDRWRRSPRLLQSPQRLLGISSEAVRG